MLERSTISALDSQHMLSSIEVLEKQCQEAWNATKNISFPDQYKTIDRIVLFGMGGSALGMDIVKNLYSQELPIPIEIQNDYSVPGCINEKTLVILSSYSGTTEETVEASQHILEKTKNVFVITTGGDLKTFAADNNLPAYIFEPTFNPSNQPRMAVGYSVMGTIGALRSLGFISTTDEEVASMIEYISTLHSLVGADVAIEQNPIKQLAQKMQTTLPVLVSSEFLLGSTHVFTNQTNENGKHFAVRFPIPEMNHHLIEGLVYPKALVAQLLFVFITSEFYHPRNSTRHQITAQVVERAGSASTQLVLHGATPFQQAFELLLYGSYTSFYLAILNGIDPSPIPNVDYLKDELKKS